MPDALTNQSLFLPPKTHKARRLAVFLLAITPFLVGVLAVCLGQDANWDLRNYHWYNAYAFLNGRYGVDLLPSQTPWFYNPTMDVPFYLLATHVPSVVAGFILGCVQGLNFILLFMLAYASLIIANPRHKVLACAGLAAMGMLGGGGIALIGTTFYDNITSLGVFLSALLVLRYYDELANAAQGRAFGLALLCGIPAGMAMGLKLPCFTFSFGLCVGLLSLRAAWMRRFSVSFVFGLGVLIGVAMTMGHWAWYLQIHFGNPIFPYFNDVFKSPMAPANSARDIEFVPQGLHDKLFFPFIFATSPFRTGEIPWRDWRIPILYALLPLAVLVRLIFGRNRTDPNSGMQPDAARFLLWSAVAAYVVWMLMFGIYRYLVPIEMLAPLLIVFAVGLLPLRPMARSLLTVFILAVAMGSLQAGNWGRHKGWIDHFVEVAMPPLGDASDAMLLMAGIQPYSFLLPSFPPNIPVVRLQSNFASPEQGRAINRVIEVRLEGHHGRFLLLIPVWEHKKAQAALGYFKLTPDWKSCQTVRDLLYDGVFDLCPVSRTKE